MPSPYRRDLTHYAGELRKRATRQENHLWYDFLRSYPVRFRRQKPIGQYIVDFYCHKAALIIELDGSQHYTKHTAEYDRERSKYFEAFGLEVMRFTNAEIDNSFSAVCDLIDAAVRRKTDRI